MSGNRRRGSRRRERAERPAGETRAAGGGAGRANARPGWRRTLDSWGGFSVVGSILGAVAVVVVLVVLNRPGSSVSDDPYVPIARAAVDGKSWGSASAPVKVIEFADFQCPFCRAFSHDVEPLLAQEFIDAGTVQLTYHHLAFLGPESGRAGEAAECAADQGRFWDYHDLLFLRQGRENSGAFSNGNLKDFARELRDAYADFDVDTFNRCLDSGGKRAVVDAATQEAASAGIAQTPSFLINGKLLTASQSIEVFRQAIQQALAASGAGS
ncbi:MAG: thioredoxin domain-containing protein [Dehalococcoidia bacterium]